MTEKTLGQIAYEAGIANDPDIGRYAKPLEWNLLDQAFRHRYKCEAAAIAERCAEIADKWSTGQQIAKEIRQLIENNKEDKRGVE